MVEKLKNLPKEKKEEILAGKEPPKDKKKLESVSGREGIGGIAE